jgi:hypothetical protein
MAIKITISKQTVACDKKKTALVCSWSENITLMLFLAEKTTHVIFSLQKHTRAVFLFYFWPGTLFTKSP